MESLGKLHGLFGVSVNDQVATDKRDDAVVKSWLSVEGDDLVLNAGHDSKFGHDSLHAKELLTFVGEHGHLSVEALEGGSISVKSVVVVSDKILANLFERHFVNKQLQLDSLISKLKQRGLSLEISESSCNCLFTKCLSNRLARIL